MIKKLLFIFALTFSVFINAQYTDVINSNKPGFSESPYSVGSGIYQFETNLFFRKANATPTFSNPEALGLNLFFRTSFFSEKLEVNFNSTFQNDKIAFKNIFESSYSKTGLSQFSLAAKYLVYSPKYSDKTKEIRSWKARHSFDWKRWIPHVGVYAGVNFGNLLTDYHERGGISPKVGVLLQNEFSHKLNVITNIYYDYIGSDFSQFSYIITGTYNFNNYWSGFAEMQGTFETYEKSSNLGIGAAYLFNEDLFANFWIGIGMWVLFFVILLMGVFSVKKLQEGFISFRDAVSVFTLPWIVNVLISIVFTILLFHVIDADLAARVSELTIETTVSFMEKVGTPQEAIDQTIEEMQKQDNYSISKIFLGNLSSIIFALIVGLIVAAIAKKEKPVFENTVD